MITAVKIPPVHVKTNHIAYFVPNQTLLPKERREGRAVLMHLSMCAAQSDFLSQ